MEHSEGHGASNIQSIHRLTYSMPRTRILSGQSIDKRIQMYRWRIRLILPLICWYVPLKQVDKTALSVNMLKKKRFNFLYIFWTVCVWDSYRLKCDKCDITIIARVLLGLFGMYCKVWYILKYYNPTKYKNDNFIPRSKELIPAIFLIVGVIYTSVFL